jgi:hypothetical protein
MPLNYPHRRTLLRTNQEQHVVITPRKRRGIWKKSTTSLLLKTKNKSNSLPEIARVGEIAT